MKNKARHKFAPSFKRYLLTEPATMRENLRFIDSLTPEERKDFLLVRSMATCNPEEGEQSPSIIKQGRSRKITKSVKTRNFNPRRRFLI